LRLLEIDTKKRGSKLNHDPIWNNILARSAFLGFVEEEFSDLLIAPLAHEAIRSYESCIFEGETNIGVHRNLIGYARIHLKQAFHCVPLLISLENWAKTFNLNTHWFLDHLLETISILLIEDSHDNDRIVRAWRRALVEQNTRWAIHGPELVFRYTWPARLSWDRSTPLEIDAHYQNPLRVLNDNFLLDIKEKFASHAFAQVRCENVGGDLVKSWSALEQIAREVVTFNRKLDAFKKRAGIAVKSFLKEQNDQKLASAIKGRKTSRNLHWLVMYQVKAMSYGMIAKRENADENTVIDGVKAAARLIDLELRPPNKAGRKKGSLTLNTSNHIVR